MQIVADRLAMFRVSQDGRESRENTIAIRWQRVLEPVQRLNDPHGWPPRPVQLARCGVLEVDLQLVQLNRASSSVGVDYDVRRNGGGQPKVVGCR